MARQTKGFVFRTWGGALKGAGAQAGGRRGRGAARAPTQGRRPRSAAPDDARRRRAQPPVPAMHQGDASGLPRRQRAVRLPAGALRRPTESSSLDRRGQEQARAQRRRARNSDRDRDAAQYLLGRKGRVFTERYHAVPLGSPRQVRRALAYVARFRNGTPRASSARADDSSIAARRRRGFDGFKNVAPGGALEQDGRRSGVRGSSAPAAPTRARSIRGSPRRTLLRASGDLAGGPWSAWAREPDVSMVSVERTCDPLGVQRTARLFALAEHQAAGAPG